MSISYNFEAWSHVFHKHPFHHPGRRSGHGDSYEIISLNNTSRKLIFVHGFNGCPTESWVSFHKLLTGDASMAMTSMYFYEYDSKHLALDLSVQRLTEYVTYVSECDSSDAPIYLIGHSLGGLICRLGLMRLYESDAPILKSIQLILFAPAQAGARDIEGFLRETLGWWYRFTVILRKRWVILDDINPNSPGVVELSTFLKDGKGTLPSNLIPIIIVVPTSDEIVHQRLLAGDPGFFEVHDATHGTVSKPTSFRDKRYEALRKFIK